MDPIQTTHTESGAVHTHSRRDPAIREPLVDVRVKCLRGGQTYENWQIPKGEHTIRIPKSKVAALWEMVLDTRKWEAAVEAHENDIQALVDNAKNNRDGRSREELTAYFRETIQSSPEARYVDLYRKSPGVFASVEVLDGEYAPPEDEERAGTVNLTADALVKALGPLVEQFLKQQGRAKH